MEKTGPRVSLNTHVRENTHSHVYFTIVVGTKQLIPIQYPILPNLSSLVCGIILGSPLAVAKAAAPLPGVQHRT